MSETRAILHAAPARWDELCFSIPAVRALVAAGMNVGVLCDERQRPVWETIPGISIISFPVKAKAKVLAAEISENWDAAILWEPGLAAEACVRAKISRRIGHQSKELKKFLTDPIDLAKAPGPVEHRVRHYLSLVEKLGIAASQPEFFAPAFSGQAAGTVLLCPDSDFGSPYEWPLARWIEVGRALLEMGLRITVAGLPGCRDMGKALHAALGESVRFLEAEPLAGAIEILAIHQIVVAAEGSLPHVAAHAGATCVTLFGPGDPAWKRPLGRRHVFVRRHVECAPCFLVKCPLDLRCQNDLTTARVMAALREKIG